MPDKPLIILYADDDEEDRLIFREGITESGEAVQVVEFHNGANLIHYLRQIREDDDDCYAIISDMKMPGMGGTDILKAVQKSDRLRRIPVVIFSTSSSLTDQQLCQNLGALAFLSKPSSFDEVKQTAGTIIRMFRGSCTDKTGSY